MPPHTQPVKIFVSVCVDTCPRARDLQLSLKNNANLAVERGDLRKVKKLQEGGRLQMPPRPLNKFPHQFSISSSKRFSVLLVEVLKASEDAMISSSASIVVSSIPSNAICAVRTLPVGNERDQGWERSSNVDTSETKGNRK